MSIDKIRTSFEEMHKHVSNEASANREEQIRNHKKNTNLILPDFYIGNFVLVRRAQNKRQKMSFKWLAPRRITRIVRDMVYDVTGLDGKGEERVHAARLIMYQSGKMELKSQERFQSTHSTRRPIMK